MERSCRLTESSTLQPGVLLLCQIKEYSSSSHLDGLIQHQLALLIRYPAATLHEFNNLVG
jgi:hypothetical protein